VEGVERRNVRGNGGSECRSWKCGWNGGMCVETTEISKETGGRARREVVVIYGGVHILFFFWRSQFVGGSAFGAWFLSRVVGGALGV
jgi:hypothetical protein